MANSDDIKLILKAAVTANPQKMTVRDLEQDFKKHEGCEIPFRELGFSDLESYLRSIPDALVVVGSGVNAEVRVVVGEKTAHIVNMISKQKSSTKNNAGKARRIPFNSNVNIEQNTQQNYNSGRFPNNNNSNYKLKNDERRFNGKKQACKNSFGKKTNSFSIPGGSKNNFEKPPINLLVTRNVDSNLSVKVPDWKNLKNNCQMKQNNNLAPKATNSSVHKSSYVESLPQNQLSSNLSSPTKDSNDQNQASKNLPKTRSFLTISNVQNIHNNQELPLPNTSHTNTTIRNKSSSNSSTSLTNSNPPQVPVFSDKSKKVKMRDLSVTSSSSSSSVSSEIERRRKTGAIPKVPPETPNGVTKCDETNYKIPMVIQRNLEKLIVEHPRGVWCASLPVLYKNKYGCELNYATYGFKSLIQMCSDLHYIFHHKLAPKGDFKLYYKKNPIPENDPDLLNIPLKQGVETSSILMETKNALPPITNNFWSFSSCMYPPDVVMKGEFIPREVLDVELGEYVDIRIGEIYDPSKFWFYLYQNEWKLNKLMDDMQDFYNANHKCMAIPKMMIQEHMYCVSMFMNEFHRAIICNLLPLTPSKVKVFFVDYGTVSVVATDNLFFLHKDFKGLPEQALRGRLAKIYPPFKKTQWSLESSDRFLQLVYQKILAAQIVRIDGQRCAFELLVADNSGENDIYVNDTLVFDGHAIFTHQVQEEIHIKPEDIPIVKYLHLFPTFEEIELGLVASTHEMITLQPLGIPLSSLYPQYFKESYKDSFPTQDTCKTEERLPRENREFLNENVQNFFNQEFPEKLCGRDRKIVLKQEILNKVVHIISFNQLPYVSVEEIQKTFLDKVEPILGLRRKFAFGHFITFENINFKTDSFMKENLLSCGLVDENANFLDVILLKYLPEFLHELSNISIDSTEMEKLLKLYDYSSTMWKL